MDTISAHGRGALAHTGASVLTANLSMNAISADGPQALRDGAAGNLRSALEEQTSGGKNVQSLLTWALFKPMT